jgi:hypothetical protein
MDAEDDVPIKTQPPPRESGAAEDGQPGSQRSQGTEAPTATATDVALEQDA